MIKGKYIFEGRVYIMRPYKGDKHQKKEEQNHDGINVNEKIRGKSPKNPPKYENFDGKPIE